MTSAVATLRFREKSSRLSGIAPRPSDALMLPCSLSQEPRFGLGEATTAGPEGLDWRLDGVQNGVQFQAAWGNASVS